MQANIRKTLVNLLPVKVRNFQLSAIYFKTINILQILI